MSIAETKLQDENPASQEPVGGTLASETALELHQWFAEVIPHLPEKAIALVARSTGRGQWQPEAVHPADPDTIRDSALLLPLIEAADSEQCPLVDDENDPDFISLALPLQVVGENWVMAVRLARQYSAQIDVLLPALQARMDGLARIRLNARCCSLDTQMERLKGSLEVWLAGLEGKGFRESAKALVSMLALKAKADRVTLGWVAGAQVDLLAVSQTAEFKKGSDPMRWISQAMKEAMLRACVRASPPLTADQPEDRNLLRLRELTGAGQIICVPLFDDDGCVAVLCIESQPDTRYSDEDVEWLQSVGQLIVPVLKDRRRADRPMALLFWDRLRVQAARMFGPGYILRKLIALSLAGLIATGLLVEGQFRVTADARLEGVVQRTLTALEDGYIATQYARAGDHVTSGQTLAELEDTDIRLEILRLKAERASLEAQIQALRARGERSELQVKQAELKENKARLSQVEVRLARTKMVAPFEGYVVEGDLSQRLGTAVSKGETLFVVAPLDAYRLVIMANEWDMSNIHPAQTGTLTLDALPAETFPVRVTRLTSVEETEEGTHRFRVEARVDALHEAFRPGLRGVVRLDAGQRPLWEIWTYRMRHAWRLFWWRWWPVFGAE